MSYEEFVKLLMEEYYGPWLKGLKQQANENVANFLVKFDELDINLQNNIYENICNTICDGEDEDDDVNLLLQRGHGGLTSELYRRIEKYLRTEATENNKMPHLRWYYELFNSPMIYSMLNDAYSHKDCDEKTVDLLFSSQITTLFWGAYHLNEGKISIDQPKYLLTIDLCQKIINDNKFPISPRLFNQYNRFKEVYNAYYKFLREDNINEFVKYYNDNGFSELRDNMLYE